MAMMQQTAHCEPPPVSSPVVATVVDPDNSADVASPAVTNTVDEKKNTPKVITPDESSVPTVNRLYVKTNFKTKEAKQYKVGVATKNDKWQVCIPKGLHGSRRIYLQFSKRHGQGTSRPFGEFIKENLTQTVMRWSSLAKARKWCCNSETRQKWKISVVESWEVRLNRQTRPTKRKFSETETGTPVVDLTKLNESPLVYGGLTEGCCIVAIPEYHDTPEKLRTGKRVQGIRVREQKAYRGRSCSKRAQVTVSIPKTLRGNDKRFILTMGTKFGVNTEWFKFVLNYVQYAVSSCASFKELYRWCNRDITSFATLLQQLYGRREATNQSIIFGR